MMPIKRLAVAILSLSSLSSAAASAAAPPRPFLHKILSIRGGAGPLPLDETAKFASAFYLTHALYQKLAPAKSATAYGLDQVDDTTEWMSEGNADINLALGVASTMLFFKTPSTSERAIGAGLLLGPVLGNVKNLLNDAPEGVSENIAVKGQWLNLVINGFVTHALLSSADYATTALKAYSLWLLANGILCAVSPDTISKVWGGGDSIDDQSTSNKVLVRVIGQNCAGLGTFCGAIALGKSPTQALGYAFVPILANVINCQFINKSFEEADMKDGPIYGWIAMLVAFVVTLAVELPEAAATDAAK